MKILIATGGSAHSDLAVCSGAELARATNSRMTILTIIKDAERRAEAQAIIDRAVGLARLNGTAGNGRQVAPVETRVRLGHPAEEIVHEAMEGSYGLIVVGTWPKPNLLQRLLAPTTERVVMQAPCPVLVAKGLVGPLRNVLLCVSGADSPSRAAGFLTDMAARMNHRLEITVLHVMSQISAGPEAEEHWQLAAPAEQLMYEGTPEGQWLRSEVDALGRTGALLHPKVRHGFVVDEVLMEAQEGDCNLLVVGAHRQAGWQRFLLDDLTHQIAVRADRSVLIV